MHPTLACCRLSCRGQEIESIQCGGTGSEGTRRAQREKFWVFLASAALPSARSAGRRGNACRDGPPSRTRKRAAMNACAGQGCYCLLASRHACRGNPARTGRGHDSDPGRAGMIRRCAAWSAYRPSLPALGLPPAFMPGRLTTRIIPGIHAGRQTTRITPGMHAGECEPQRPNAIRSHLSALDTTETDVRL